jgi:hypothetical protein
MNKNFKITTLALILFLTLPVSVLAHPGRTDANGCHTNRKTGEYHCHNTPAISETKKARTEARVLVKTKARSIGKNRGKK